jgi:hypothetical protein
MAGHRQTTLCIGLALAALMLVALPAASAMANAEVRLVNARGGSDPVRLEVTVAGQTVPAGGATAFGKSSESVSVPAGDAQLSLVGGTDSAEAAAVDKTLADGASYTVLALPKGDEGFELQVLRNGTAAPGDAKLRLVHAAPELGKPDIRLGDRTLAQRLGFGSETGYLKVDPGAYELAVARPGGEEAVLSMKVSLAAGTASTIVVAGTGGSEARLIELHDDTVTPAGAPHTGLGGLADEQRPWVLAILAALLAGAAGGALQFARTRR